MRYSASEKFEIIELVELYVVRAFRTVGLAI